jgi:hypothetical protein
VFEAAGLPLHPVTTRSDAATAQLTRRKRFIYVYLLGVGRER